MKRFFYNQKKYLDEMLRANQDRKMELEEELRYRTSLLDLLFNEPDVTLKQVVTFNQEDHLYLQLPFLAIVDFKSNLLYVIWIPF